MNGVMCRNDTKRLGNILTCEMTSYILPDTAKIKDLSLQYSSNTVVTKELGCECDQLHVTMTRLT